MKIIQDRFLVCVLFTLALSGCATTYTDADRLAPGSLPVQHTTGVVLYDSLQERDVSMRVAWPDGDGTYPVVVFSHGAFCYPQQYAGVTDFWVSRGYVVIFPDHLDSPNGGKMKMTDAPKLLSSRVRDMSFVLDERARIESLLPEFRGKLDRDRAAVAGHSFGGMIAMVEAGLTLKGFFNGEPTDYSDSRFAAAVVMSGVGQMEQMTDDAFSRLQTPLFASGGTLDEGNVGTGEIYPWQWRMSPYTLAPAGDKYSLVIDKADHYLGGQICRTNKGGPDDPDAVRLVRAANTAFLDAYVKGDRGALNWLRQADWPAISGQRAVLEFK